MFLFKKQKNASVGNIGERLAEKFLQRQGMKILARNFANKKGRRLGEIDLVAKDAGETVFIEVKTRILKPSLDVLPEEKISPSKLHKLNKIAYFYLKKNQLLDQSYRFDAISILMDEKEQKHQIRHLKNIFY